MSSYRDVKSDNKVNVAHFSAYRLSPSNINLVHTYTIPPAYKSIARDFFKISKKEKGVWA